MSRLVILSRLYKWWGHWDVLTYLVVKLHLLMTRWSLRARSILSRLI